MSSVRFGPSGSWAASGVLPGRIDELKVAAVFLLPVEAAPQPELSTDRRHHRPHRIVGPPFQLVGTVQVIEFVGTEIDRQAVEMLRMLRPARAVGEIDR